MLWEGTFSKKWKMFSKAGPSTTLATVVPPPPMHMEVPPATKPTAPPPPLVPTIVREALKGLEELFSYIINHLEKMANKLNSIELRVEWLSALCIPNSLTILVSRSTYRHKVTRMQMTIKTSDLFCTSVTFFNSLTFFILKSFEILNTWMENHLLSYVSFYISLLS